MGNVLSIILIATVSMLDHVDSAGDAIAIHGKVAVLEGTVPDTGLPVDCCLKGPDGGVGDIMIKPHHLKNGKKGGCDWPEHDAVRAAFKDDAIFTKAAEAHSTWFDNMAVIGTYNKWEACTDEMIQQFFTTDDHQAKEAYFRAVFRGDWRGILAGKFSYKFGLEYFVKVKQGIPQPVLEDLTAHMPDAKE